MGRKEAEAISKLSKDLVTLRSRVQLRPVRQTASAIRLFQIVGGNTLAVTGYAGVKRATVTPASIIDYDITTSPTCVDGIGYARDYTTGLLVLLMNAPPSLIQTDLWAGDVIMCFSSTQVLITGSNPARYRLVWTPAVIQS